MGSCLLIFVVCGGFPSSFSSEVSLLLFLFWCTRVLLSVNLFGAVVFLYVVLFYMCWLDCGLCALLCAAGFLCDWVYC